MERITRRCHYCLHTIYNVLKNTCRCYHKSFWQGCILCMYNCEWKGLLKVSVRSKREPLCIDTCGWLQKSTFVDGYVLLVDNEIPPYRMPHYMFFHTFVVFCSFPGLTSIMAQFPDINPYHWPGWFVTAEAMFIATAVIFCFTETRSCKYIKSSHFKISSSLNELRLFTKSRTKSCIRLIVSFF